MTAGTGRWIRWDNDGVRDAPGPDRRDDFVPPYAHAGGVAWATRVGRRTDASVGGWDHRGCVYHLASRVAVWAAVVQYA